MREIRTSGSVGGPVRQLAGSTRFLTGPLPGVPAKALATPARDLLTGLSRLSAGRHVASDKPAYGCLGESSTGAGFPFEIALRRRSSKSATTVSGDFE